MDVETIVVGSKVLGGGRRLPWSRRPPRLLVVQPGRRLLKAPTLKIALIVRLRNGITRLEAILELRRRGNRVVLKAVVLKATVQRLAILKLAVTKGSILKLATLKLPVLKLPRLRLTVRKLTVYRLPIQLLRVGLIGLVEEVASLGDRL